MPTRRKDFTDKDWLRLIVTAVHDYEAGRETVTETLDYIAETILHWLPHRLDELRPNPDRPDFPRQQAVGRDQ
jgi:hypothetical protein